jgi:hypothetical protein
MEFEASTFYLLYLPLCSVMQLNMHGNSEGYLCLHSCGQNGVCVEYKKVRWGRITA